MKNEEAKMMIFSTWVEYFDLHSSETLNFADFKNVFRFFISCFRQKLQPCKLVAANGQNRAKTGKLDRPTL